VVSIARCIYFQLSVLAVIIETDFSSLFMFATG
jgi:hypothetical protein